MKTKPGTIRFLALAGFTAWTLSVTSASATPITADGSWHEFLFGLAGTFATGCGGGCVPTINPVAEDTSSPPWTFTDEATITVLDMFQRGDRFQLFDFGVSVGLTSVPINDGANLCDNNIGTCLVTPGYSLGTFVLGPGSHSLTIEIVQNAAGTSGGAAVFQASPTIPEPATITLLGIGLIGTGTFLRRRRPSSKR